MQYQFADIIISSTCVFRHYGTGLVFILWMRGRGLRFCRFVETCDDHYQIRFLKAAPSIYPCDNIPAMNPRTWYCARRIPITIKILVFIINAIIHYRPRLTRRYRTLLFGKSVQIYGYYYYFINRRTVN